MANKWVTERPTEPGFYFATDGSPCLLIEARLYDGSVFEVASTWQTSWAGRTDIPEDSMSDEAVIMVCIEPKYWQKIETPSKPGG